VYWWIWIIIVVVALALIALIVGLVLGRRRKVSLTAPAQPGAPEAKPAPPKGGGYKAGGSISFSAGSGTATQERPPTVPTAPEVPAGGPAEPVTKPMSAPVSELAEPVTKPMPAPVTEPPTPSDTAAPATESPAAPVTEPPGTPAAAPEAEHPSGTGASAPTAAPDNAAPAGSAPVGDTVTAPPDTPDQAAPAEPAAPGDVVTGPEAAPIGAEPGEEIAPTAGRLSRLRGRLSRSQSVFGKSLLGLLGAGDLDEDSWQDVEDTLLLADLGAGAAAEITATLRQRVASQGVADTAAARALLRSVLIDAVGTDADRSVRALPHDGRPAVALVVGVNGTGKTTTTGKLARVLVADGRSVVLGAADTFRAAASEQLATWAERSGATVVRGAEGADPAAVAFDAVRKGIDAGVDAVLIDTAGRLHTKTGLMDELGKVKRVVEKQAKVDEVLLVLDATTGQNGLVQAKVFADVVDVTGIVLTKLDGTAKGGIVVAVQRALGVPVKLVGLGEGPDDLAPFEPAAFVDALLGD
jgi:fused signal recognition particle receptor